MAGECHLLSQQRQMNIPIFPELRKDQGLQQLCSPKVWQHLPRREGIWGSSGFIPPCGLISHLPAGPGFSQAAQKSTVIL